MPTVRAGETAVMVLTGAPAGIAAGLQVEVIDTDGAVTWTSTTVTAGAEGEYRVSIPVTWDVSGMNVTGGVIQHEVKWEHAGLGIVVWDDPILVVPPWVPEDPATVAGLTAREGETVTAWLTGAPTGWAGDLTVNVRAPSGAVAWTQTGVTEVGDAYTVTIPITWDLSGHAVTGGVVVYQIEWDHPDQVSSAWEQLTVTPATTIVAGDLCSLAQVKRDPTLASIGTALDPLITELIGQVSREAQIRMGRWVVAENAATRTYDVAGFYRTRRVPTHDLQGTPTNVDVTIDGTTTATNVTVTPLPIDRVSGEPITGLEFPAGVLTEDSRIVVTGNWGWPGGVPTEIQHAAIETVVFNLRRRRALTSISPDQDEYATGPQLLFPAAAMQILDAYRFTGIA